MTNETTLVHRDQLRAQRSVTSMGKLYLFTFLGLAQKIVVQQCKHGDSPGTRYTAHGDARDREQSNHYAMSLSCKMQRGAVDTTTNNVISVFSFAQPAVTKSSYLMHLPA